MTGRFRNTQPKEVMMPNLPTPLRVLARRPQQRSAPVERTRVSPLVNCATYVDGVRDLTCADPAVALARVRALGRGFVWVGFHEPNDAEMTSLASTFGLHPLAVEDAVQAHQRPKLENYGDFLFFVVKTMKFVEHASTGAAQIVAGGEIMMFLGSDFIITVRHGDHSGLSKLRAGLEANAEKLTGGPAAVMHAITDQVVDEYLSVIGEVEEDIDEMETAVFSPHSTPDTEDIYLLKREILGLRRAVSPLAGPLRTLSTGTSPLVPDEVREYFRDVADHLSHVSERIATFDEMLTTLVAAALAEVTTRQNEDMRKISAWAAIALVPTAIAGIYGMNFDHMPELHWTFGYPMAIGVIVAICVLLHRVLRRRGWL